MVIRFIRKMEQNTKNNGLHEGTAGASRQSGVAARRRREGLGGSTGLLGDLEGLAGCLDAGGLEVPGGGLTGTRWSRR